MTENIPKDVLNKLGTFSRDLTAIEKAVAEYVKITPEQQEKLTPLERARRNLLAASAVNSLYCMYSSTLGKDPQKEEDVGIESRRIQEMKTRLEEIEARPFRAKVNTKVAKAFIRNALADNSTDDKFVGTVGDQDNTDSHQMEDGVEDEYETYDTDEED